MLDRLKRRTAEYLSELAAIRRALRRNEITLRTALAQAWERTSHYFRHLFRKAESRERKHARSYVKMGQQQFNKREYKAAANNLKKAVKLDPGYARAWFYLGYAQYHMNHVGEALASWNRAMEAEPNSEFATRAGDKIRSLSRGEKLFLTNISTGKPENHS